LKASVSTDSASGGVIWNSIPNDDRGIDETPLAKAIAHPLDLLYLLHLLLMMKYIYDHQNGNRMRTMTTMSEVSTSFLAC
jgi:hypothetical protein